MNQLNTHKAISKSERILLNRCRQAIRSIDPLAEVILYGSRARGEALPDSDYDLLILTNNKVSLKKEDLFCRQLFPIELETGAVLTVIALSRKDWDSSLYKAMPLYQNVRKDGIVL